MAPWNPNRATLPDVGPPPADTGTPGRSLSAPVPALRIAALGMTHTGRRRKKNEDRFLVDHDGRVYVVADGMGGHAAGEVAAQIAVDMVGQSIAESASDGELATPHSHNPHRTWDENRLTQALQRANAEVLARSLATPRLRGMGTTAVALLAGHDGVTVAHVGDSRAYLARGGTLKALTDDHTLWNELRRVHAVDGEPSEAQKNVLVRALGTEPNLAVDLARVEPRRGDVFLLCSDGLHGSVPDDVILEVIQNSRTLDAAARALIDEANRAGGPDNVTVVLVAWP